MPRMRWRDVDIVFIGFALLGLTVACLGTVPAADVVKLPCTECLVEISQIACGKTCHGHFEQSKNALGCSLITCPSGTVLAIEDEHGEFALLNGLLCNNNRRWTGADWIGPTTVFAKCLPLCQACAGISRYRGDCPQEQCTDLAPTLIDENGCARMIPPPGYNLFSRVNGQLKQTSFLQCSYDQVWLNSRDEDSDPTAIAARPTPECAQCSNLHFPRTLLKEFAYYIHDEPKINPLTGCMEVTCANARQLLVSPTTEPLVAASQLTCNARRKWQVDNDPNEFAFMNVVCGAASQCAGCNLQVTTDFCPSEICEDLSLLQEYTDDECLQFSCENEKTLYVLSQEKAVLTAQFVQCNRDWRWMTNTGVLLDMAKPALGCGSGPLRCLHCPPIFKYNICPSGHVCYSVPPPAINSQGCLEIMCERGFMQVAGIPTVGDHVSLRCNYESEWSVHDADGSANIGTNLTANCAIPSKCANCGLVSMSSACLTQRCEPHLEAVTESDCKQVLCPLGQQLYVEVGTGDLQPVDRLSCTAASREWLSESEDSYGENVKVACGAGPLKCTSCANLTAAELPCPQARCNNLIEYNLLTGCKVAQCPRGQSLYLEYEGAPHLVAIEKIQCESDFGWYVDGHRIGVDPSVVCGEGPHLCTACSAPPYTKECPLNVFCDPLQLDILQSEDECQQFTCRSGYGLHVDDGGKWANAEYLQCTDWDSVIAVGRDFLVENAIVVTCVSECSQCPDLPYLKGECPVSGFCQDRLQKVIQGQCARTICNNGVLHVRSEGAWRQVEDGVECNAERKWTHLGAPVTAAVCTSCACSVDFYNEESLDEFCEGWSECLALYPVVASVNEFTYELQPDRCSFRHECPAGYKLLMIVEKSNGHRESVVYEDVHPRDYEVGFVCSVAGKFQFVKRSTHASTLYQIRSALCAREL